MWDFVCREGVNRSVSTAARIVESGLSHRQDCIFHSENCLLLLFPEPLSKPVTMGQFSPLQGIWESAASGVRPVHTLNSTGHL